MKELGSLLNPDNIERAIRFVLKNRPRLRPGTRYALDYKGEQFPPKEIARIAARLDGHRIEDYRLQGGPNAINKWFERLGYKIVQVHTIEAPGPVGIEERIARICYNEFGWVEPSGIEGKSSNQETHEAKFGYGHEEWLFDTSSLIDDYHYGFIEPIRERTELYQGQVFDVRFFTINGRTKERFWAGRITRLEVLTAEQAESAKLQYKKRGWLDTMEGQVKAIQKDLPHLEKKGWSNYHGLQFFNVRYKPEHLLQEAATVVIPQDHPITAIRRYNFVVSTSEYIAGFPDEWEEFEFETPNDIDERNDRENKTYIRRPQPIEMTFLHERISRLLVQTLRKRHGLSYVRPEHPARFLGRKIDIVVRTDSGHVFYEIKTYNSLILSIREAIGQLLEYAHWQRASRSSKWVIVTQPHPEISSAVEYIRHLRERYGIPVYYQSFDPNRQELSVEY